MKNRSLPAAILLGASLCAAPSRAQTIRVAWGSHLPRAQQVTTTWAASCGTMKYELKVSREGKSVILSRGDGVEADLSATTLGARLLDEDVLAEVGFNCPMHALNIFLKGVKLVDLGPPQGFRDAISVREDGQPGKSEPREVRVDELAIARSTGEIPSAAERDRRACEAVK